MKSITFTVSKGGVGKSLMTANVGASLARKHQKVVLVEGDPNQPLQKLLGVTVTPNDPKLDDVVEKDVRIDEAMYPTDFDGLALIPSGVSLQSYFEIDPINYARKLGDLDADFVFIDVPFPLGKAAFLALGVCEYFVPVVTEDEFVLCVESAIDTIRLGKYFLRSIPLGFVFNRIKTPSKFTKEFIQDLAELLEISCIARIQEDPQVSKSYGEAGSQKAFLAYHKLSETPFAKAIDEIATFLIGKLPPPEKKDAVGLLKQVAKA
jgi:septum site-determining protein MinD